MLKDMLYSLSSRPALIIAPILIILALSVYYWDKQASCTTHASLRYTLNQEAQKLAPASVLKLTDMTSFVWDKVKIFNNFEPTGKSPDCPFGWDWSEDERQEIIDAGLMTVLVFANEGRLVDYIELRSDQLEINVGEESLTPENALFSIKGDKSEGNKLTLILASSKLSQ